jgi:hypothetical protein
MRSRAVPAIATGGRAAVILALTACGRIHFAERQNPDAASDVAIDALGTCDVAAPFGVPVPIAELNDPASNDGTLRLFADERSGYFWSFRGAASSGLYLATRADLASPFSITPVQGLGLAGNLLDPSFTADGSLLVFRRSMPGDDLYEATRVAPDTFMAATAIASLDTGATEVQPFLPLAGDLLVFSSSRTGGGDLYTSTRTGDSFSAPSQITELATADDEGDPVLSPDGLTLYFRSDRPAAQAGYNIFVATRPTTADPFGVPDPVPNVSSDADDGPSWISPDGCRLYLSSDRAGTNDIYVSTRGG